MYLSRILTTNSTTPLLKNRYFDPPKLVWNLFKVSNKKVEIKVGTRVGFGIVEMKKFLNYFSKYTFAL